MEQFWEIDVMVFAPPSSTPFVPMIFDEFQGGEFLQVVIEVFIWQMDITLETVEKIGQTR